MIDINELRRLALAGDLAAMQAIVIRLERAEKGRDALRAKIEAMEKQEPFAWIARGGYPVPLDTLEWQLWIGSGKPTLSWVNQETRPLYALPGAQPAPSIPSTDLRPVIEWLRNGCDPMKAADELAMLAAAPESKP